MTKDAKARRVVAAIVCLAFAGWFVSAVTQERPRLAGGNSVPPHVPVIGLNNPGDEGCQVETTLPAGAERLALGTTSFGKPGPSLAAKILLGKRVIARGHLKGGYPDVGAVYIPIPPVKRTILHTTVCVKNLGPGPMNFYGNATQFGTPLVAVGTKEMAALTFIFDAKPDTYLDRLPAIVHHADTGGTQVFGTLTLWVALALLLAAASAALVVTLREADR
jgi:hypothetical protein